MSIHFKIFATCRQCKVNSQQEQFQSFTFNQYYPDHLKYPQIQNFDSKSLQINNIENQCIIKPFQSTNNKNLQLKNVKNSIIVIYDSIKCLTGDDLTDCHIFVASCDGSIFLRNCKNIRISAATVQFRMKDCIYCSCFLLSKTQPVIENSQNILFGPFLYSVEAQTQDEANNQIQFVNQQIENALIYSQNIYANTINKYFQAYDFTEDEQKQNYESILLPEKCHQNLWQQPPVIMKEEQTINNNVSNIKAVFVTNGYIPITKNCLNIQDKQEIQFQQIQGIQKCLEWKQQHIICYQVIRNQDGQYVYYLCKDI